MRELPETLEKDLQDRKLASFSLLVSVSEQLPFFWQRNRFAALFPWVWLIWCPVWNSGADFSW